MLKRVFSGSKSRRVLAGLGAALLALLITYLDGGPQDRRVDPSVPINTNPFGIPEGSYTLRGLVSKVADGDTVTLIVDGKPRRVRLDSIDAPELGGSGKPSGQPYSQAAQKYLQNLIGGKTLTAHCYEKDQYSREICALILPDGESANRKMVESGYAWAYTARRGEYLRDDAMVGLQRQARQAGAGLWAQGGPTEPWKWRYESSVGNNGTDSR